MPETVKSASLVLNSWKEIASYMARGVRTVQRWERELNLPVHRIGAGKRSPVYAIAAELNFWRSTTGITRSDTKAIAGNGRKRLLVYRVKQISKPVEHSRRLLQDTYSLVQTVAAASVRQRRQTEILRKRILEMRMRIK